MKRRAPPMPLAVPTIVLDSAEHALDLGLFLLRAGARVEVDGATVGAALPGALDEAKERAEVLAYVETWSGLKEGAVAWEVAE